MRSEQLAALTRSDHHGGKASVDDGMRTAAASCCDTTACSFSRSVCRQSMKLATTASLLFRPVQEAVDMTVYGHWEPRSGVNTFNSAAS